MTEHLTAYLRSALADAPEGVVTFQQLSDEETAAIETDDPSGFTVQPWIESQQNLDPASASLFGRRSLYLRGLLTIEADEQSGEPALALTAELRFAADARRLGVAYILARATQRGERTARNNVLQSQVGSFEEDIDTNGFHHLSACTYRAALRRLATWAVPEGRRDPSDAPTRVSSNRWHRWTTKNLGPDVRTTEINIFLPDGSGSYADDTWLTAHGDDGAVLAVPDGTSLTVTTTTAGSLQYHLAERVSAALDVRV